MENKKVITGTMVARWVGILALIVVPIALAVLIVDALRSGESIVEVFTENWVWIFGAFTSGGLTLGLTSKKEGENPE